MQEENCCLFNYYIKELHEVNEGNIAFLFAKQLPTLIFAQFEIESK